MHIRFECLIDVVTQAPCSVQALLDIHPDQRHDITEPGEVQATCLTTGGTIDLARSDLDRFGNVVRSFETGAGAMRLSVTGAIFHSGFPDAMQPEARSVSVREMPPEARLFLLPSRHCPSDQLAEQALSLFGAVPDGWRRVHAVCGYVRGKMRPGAGAPPAVGGSGGEDLLRGSFGASANATHMAMAFCRALHIPTRYCTGYLADPLAEPLPQQGTYHSWFEAYLDGAWWIFDATQAEPRIGRVLIARGQDAGDASPRAITLAGCSGTIEVTRMTVRAEEESGARFPVTAEQRRSHWCSHLALSGRGSATAGTAF